MTAQDCVNNSIIKTTNNTYTNPDRLLRALARSILNTQYNNDNWVTYIYESNPTLVCRIYFYKLEKNYEKSKP
jgi:hypothetical protein